MYDLLEYRSNCSDTIGSLWFYSKNKANNFNADISTNNALKSFDYKIKVVGDIET